MKKTPMQELIEQLKQEIENQVKFRNEFEDGVVQGLEGALDLAKGMLEEEKEVIMRVYQDGLDNGYSNGNWKLAQYYNETFNTKER